MFTFRKETLTERYEPGKASIKRYPEPPDATIYVQGTLSRFEAWLSCGVTERIAES